MDCCLAAIWGPFGLAVREPSRESMNVLVHFEQRTRMNPDGRLDTVETLGTVPTMFLHNITAVCAWH